MLPNKLCKVSRRNSLKVLTISNNRPFFSFVMQQEGVTIKLISVMSKYSIHEKCWVGSKGICGSEKGIKREGMRFTLNKS